jgi:hypothetical protein
MYLKGVSVGGSSTEAREALTRPINKMIRIPTMEIAPIKIGGRRVRSKDG